MQRRPEDLAAVVNALVVFLGPPLLMMAGSVIFKDGPTDSSTVVVAADPAPVATWFSVFGPMLAVLAPFALVTGWRTRVHAMRWRAGTGSGWAGVAEAAVLAFGIALAVLARGIVTRPLDAAPYVIAYGGAAIVLGLIVGVILRYTALVTLKCAAIAVLACVAASVTVSAQDNEYLLRPGHVGNVEIGQTADKVYRDFGHQRVRFAATFPEGQFQPVLEIRMSETSPPGPDFVARVREWPCPGYRVSGITVLDRRFRTANGLGVGSTFGDIRKRYPNAKKGTGEGERIVVISELGMTFMIEYDAALGDAAAVTSVWVFAPDIDAIRAKHCASSR